MRFTKMLGPVAIAAAITIAFVGVSAASASNTLLCKNNTALLSPVLAECGAVSEVHLLTVKVELVSGVETTKDAKAVLLNSFLNVECEILLTLSNPTGGLPTVNTAVTFTTVDMLYANCTAGCKVTVITSGTISLLKTAVELGNLTGNGFVINQNCLFGAFNCDYNMTGLVGHVLGPSFGDTGKKGHLTYFENQVTVQQKLGGVSSCPEVTKLDALFQSLTPLYIRA